MESLTIEIINPKAKKLLQSLEDLNLISISKNFLSNTDEEKEWNALSKEQQQGIFSAVDSINSGKGIPNSEVLAKVKKLVNG